MEKPANKRTELKLCKNKFRSRWKNEFRIMILHWVTAHDMGEEGICNLASQLVAYPSVCKPIELHRSWSSLLVVNNVLAGSLL